MLLTIHDSALKKVAFIDNDKQTTLNFFNDKWTRSLENATSIFQFSVFKRKIKSDTYAEQAYKHLNERAFVSFKYKGRSYLFNVMKTEEDEHIISCYCENLSLELLLEYQEAYKAPRAMRFSEYLDTWGILGVAKLDLGINEVADQQKTLQWEGQETTLARLISLARNFDAEIEFETKLKSNTQLDRFVINIYKAHSETNQGIGRRRNDVVLKYGKNIKSIKRKVDKTKLFNAIKPVGKKEVLKLMKELNSQGKTIIHITHDRNDILEATEVMVLSKGKIKYQGKPYKIFEDDEFNPFLIKIKNILEKNNIKVDDKNINMEDLVRLVYENIS
mgnify:CR=1 FL=1